MWEQTLIESKGYGRGTKKRWTIPVAAFLHVGIIAVAILASYWHLEALEAPPSNVSYLQTIPVVMTPPAPGIHHPAAANPQSKSTTPPREVQLTIIPPLETEPVTETEQTGSNQGDDSGSDLPEGDEHGVPGGDRNSSGPVGIGTAPPTDNEVHKMSVNISQPILLKRVEPD